MWLKSAFFRLMYPVGDIRARSTPICSTFWMYISQKT